MQNQVKLTFLGDITCDRPMLKAALQKDGTYSFDASFAQIAPMWQDSDLVIGNLETLFAGPEIGYGFRAYTYNAPYELAYAIQKAGIGLLTTANNHCFDVGKTGIRNTIAFLDSIGMAHTGTFASKKTPVSERYLVKEINGIKIAFVAITDDMNGRTLRMEHCVYSTGMTNLSRSFKKNPRSKYKNFISLFLPMQWITERTKQKKKKQNKPIVKIFVDNQDLSPYDEEDIQKCLDILKHAREHSDFVVACIHAGGQFNLQPGRHAVQLYERFSQYADVLVGHHPHVMQRLEKKDGKVIAYSLGGLNMSASADYIKYDVPYEFSGKLDITICKDPDGKPVVKETELQLIEAYEENQYVFMKPVAKNDQNPRLQALSLE